MAHVNECDASPLFVAPASNAHAALHCGCAAPEDNDDRFATTSAGNGDRGGDPAFASLGGPDAR